MLKQFCFKSIVILCLFSSFSHGFCSITRRAVTSYKINHKGPTEITISNRQVNIDELMRLSGLPNTTIKIDGRVKFTGLKNEILSKYVEEKSRLVFQGITNLSVCVLSNIELLPGATLEVETLNIHLTKQENPIIIGRGGTIKLNASEIRFSTKQPKLKAQINKSIKLNGYSTVYYDSTIEKHAYTYFPTTLKIQRDPNFDEPFVTIEDKTINLQNLRDIASYTKKPLKIKGRVVFTDETKKHGVSVNPCYPIYTKNDNDEISFELNAILNIVPFLKIELEAGATLEIENLNIDITTKDNPIIFGAGSKIALKYSTMNFLNTKIQPDQTKITLDDGSYIFHRHAQLLEVYKMIAGFALFGVAVVGLGELLRRQLED